MAVARDAVVAWYVLHFVVEAQVHESMAVSATNAAALS